MEKESGETFSVLVIIGGLYVFKAYSERRCNKLTIHWQGVSYTALGLWVRGFENALPADYWSQRKATEKPSAMTGWIFSRGRADIAGQYDPGEWICVELHGVGWKAPARRLGKEAHQGNSNDLIYRIAFILIESALDSRSTSVEGYPRREVPFANCGKSRNPLTVVENLHRLWRIVVREWDIIYVAG